MTWLRAWTALGCLLAVTATTAANELSEAERDGLELAKQLRGLRPAENSSLSGVLRIRASKTRRTELQVQFQTLVTATNWQAIYSARDTNGQTLAAVAVIHSENQPLQYRTSVPGSPTQTHELKLLTGNEAMVPFAGSDFWLADLGLEFLHWPGQKLLKKELRKGQSCYVLESTSPLPAANGYARVVSWIDIDSVREAGQPAIIHADAYDANRQLLKEFDPQKIKKVSGQWQLRQMEMYNVKTRSSTIIEFDLEAR